MKHLAASFFTLVAFVFCATAELSAGWSTNFNTSLAQAKAQQQPVLAYFTASWCGPCKLMARTTLTNDTVIQALKSFSPVKVDIDEQHDLAEKYGVRAVPTFKLLTAAGDEVSTTTGYQDAARFLQFLTNGVGEVQATIVRQQRFKESLTLVEQLIQKSDAESLRKAATELANLAAERDDSIQKTVKDQLTALAKRDPALLLDGLNHSRLAARIAVANALRTQLGAAFEVDAWSDDTTRQKAVSQWRARLAGKK